MRLCSGCQTKVPDDVRFCAECKAERNKTEADDGIRVHTFTDRERFAFLYSGERWKRGVQPLAFKRYPFCAMCDRLSELVDHVVPAGQAIRQAQESGRYPCDRYAGFYLLSNLQGLCRSCHGKKTLEDKAHTGPWPDVLTKEDAAPKKVWSF
jgi:5-methylcytosine-specific restriction endonuclease McrA